MPVILGGNTGIYLASLAPTVDPDAQAFITAAAITDPTQQAAINQLVVDLKGYNIWSKMKALYPFVGGTAAQHKWNLKDPRDLDAAFRLRFFGGVTHSSTGVQGNGSNGYADTYWVQNVNGTLNNQAIGVYVRTNNTYLGVDMGARIVSTSDIILSSYGGSPITGRINTLANSATIAGTPQGFYQITRNGGSSQSVFLNGSFATASITTSTAVLNRSIFLMALNDSNLLDEYHSNRQIAFSYISDGLTDTEAANFYTAVQNFNTALARQV